MRIIGSHENDRRRLLHLLKTHSYQERDATLASGHNSHLVALEKDGIHYDACGGMPLGAVH